MDTPGEMELNLAEKTVESMLKKYTDEEITQELRELNLKIASSTRANYNTIKQFLIDIVLNYADPDKEMQKIKANVIREKAREASEHERLEALPEFIDSQIPLTEQDKIDDSDTNPDASPLTDPPPTASAVSSESNITAPTDLQKLMVCMDELREEQTRQRADMMQMLQTLTAHKTSHSFHAQSKHESDFMNDPQVIDRRYEQYVTNAFDAISCLESQLDAEIAESDLEFPDEKACINVQKLTSFVEHYIFPLDYSLKRERQLQQTSLIEKNFDKAHRIARSKIKQIHKEEEQRKRQSFLPSYIRVPSFHGDVLDFPSWISEFDQLVHLNTEVHNQGKLKALKEALMGAAASTLSNFDMIGENYMNAYTLIRKRFGKPRLMVLHEVESIGKIPDLKDEATSYRKCLEIVQTRSLNLENQKADRDTVLVGLIVPKFTRTLRMAWERHLKSKIDDDACATMKDLLDFLQIETELLEASNIEKSSPKKTSSSNPTADGQKQKRIYTNVKKPAGTAQSLIATSGPQTKSNPPSTHSNPDTECCYCKKSHLLESCPAFTALNYKDRLIFVFTGKICRSCLIPFGGPRHTCHRVCSICKQKHHELLHEGFGAPQMSSHKSENPAATTQSYKHQSNVSMPTVLPVCPQTTNEPCVALPVLQARIFNRGKAFIVNIGFDSFSEKSFITKDVVVQLDLPSAEIAPLVVAGFGGMRTELKEATSFDLHPLFGCDPTTTNKPLHVEAIIRDGDICDYVSPIHLDANLEEICKQYPLARPPLDKPVRIHVLLGAMHVVSNMHVVAHIDSEGPCLMSTPFGYTVAGPYRSTSIVKRKSVNSCLVISPQPDDGDSLIQSNDEAFKLRLDKQFENYMSLESWGLDSSNSPSLSSEEEVAIQKFHDSIYFDQLKKKYEVALPFREESMPLKDNQELVFRIMMRIERQLLRCPEKLSKYNEAMQEYLDKGFAKKLTPEEVECALSQEHIFLPHHAVVKDSITTSLRVVFNASHKSSPDKLSLNEALLPGPKLQPDICQILLRFRMHRYAVAGDVSKMFCMTNISPAHWRYQLYMWRDGNTNIPPDIYAMITLMFGVTSSPFLAIKTMMYHLEKYISTHPEVVKEIRENMYVDDFLFGGSNENDVQQLCHNAIHVLEEGGWNLRKFSSNSRNVLESLAPDQRMPNSLVDFDDDEKLEVGISKTLGLVWDTNLDTFNIKILNTLLEPARKVTKRVIVSRFSSIFDVFGFVSPFTLQMKTIVQTLWKQSFDWDDPVPATIEAEYRKWESELGKLIEIKIPRWTFMEPNVIEVQLCGFSDASSTALGAVIYLRLIDTTGGTRITYLMGKSKVAPVKAVTVARLELVAALLLSKMVGFVKEALNNYQLDVHLWTDSSIVLSWLSRPSYDWKTYVRNRIQKIHDLTGNYKWYHIQGSENPADVHSRGCGLAELINNSLYWSGPSWLQLPESSWPHSSPADPTEEELQIEKSKPQCTSLPVTQKHSIVLDASNDYDQCVKYAGYMRRWLEVIRQKNNVPSDTSMIHPLTVMERKEAADGLIRYTQWNHFPQEYEALRKGNKLPKDSKLVKFKPVWDEDRRLLIAKGRLTFSHLHPEAKHPAILPSNDRLVELLILHYHSIRAHTPEEHTINLVRRRHAVLQLRTAVRRALSHCIQCKHYNAPVVQQQMGDLPEFRTGPIVASFDTMGIDYTGPLLVKAPGGKKIKAYILIGTCAQTRMVHLELTTGMDTEQTLGALRRIINRRGVPRRIVSDNAKSFIKCSLILKPPLQNFIAGEGIKWEFIVERAPHRGAFWERLIRSLKEPLRKVIGNSMLSWYDMITILSDIERHMNSRPLTYTGSDPNNHMALTPAHLVLGRSLEQLQEAPDKFKNLEACYRQQREILQQFWKRWENEYLPNLIPLHKWQWEKEALNKNDVVLVTEENTKRQQWRLARVISGIRSRDGIIRTYRLQTANGEINRPAQRLRLWETHSAPKEDTASTIKDDLTPPPIVPENTTNFIDQNNSNSVDSDILQLDTSPCVDLDPYRDLGGECSRVTKGQQTTKIGRTVRVPARYR